MAIPHAKIAIVGRPNVGKSTLFNRIVGKRISIIAKEAGTTRDRVQQPFDLDGYTLELTDTGGLSLGPKDNLEENMVKQAKVGIENADIIMLILDAAEPLNVDDFEVAKNLRKSGKPIILIANKCDNKEVENNIYDLYKLGFGEPVKVSAIHKFGIDAVNDEILKNLKKLKIKKGRKKVQKEEKPLAVSFVGRPNVGKSSLLNSILGEERVIVSDIPGTTRDSTDTEIIYKDTPITLTDTAGLRKRGHISRGIEKFSSLRCHESIQKSDVAIVLMDASEPVTSQDLHVIEIALEEKKGVILGVNKSDLISEDDRKSIERKLRYKCDFIPWAPVVFISAKNKKNIFKLLDLAKEVKSSRSIEISTTKINNFLHKVTLDHLPQAGKKIAKFFYGNQAGTNPPKFIFFFKNASLLHFSYKRYVENELRKEFGFTGTPIEIQFRDTSSSEAKR